MRPIGWALAGLALIALIARWGRLSRHGRATAVALAIAFALYGTGAVHVPDLETAVREVGATLGSYMYALVGLLAFLETAAALGLVVPGEAAVIVGGMSAGQGEISISLLVVVVWACAFAGDVTSFALGRRLGSGFLIRLGGGFGLTTQRVRQVERFMARHGGKTIVIGRFIGLVRALAPLIAGASGMRPVRFIPLAFLASGVWAAVFSGLGYLFWQSFDQATDIAKQGTLALLAVLAAIGALIVVYRYLRRPRPW